MDRGNFKFNSDDVRTADTKAKPALKDRPPCLPDDQRTAHWATRALMLLCAALLILAPFAGYFSTPGEWYAELSKPVWTPPNSIFAPVWGALYLLLAVSLTLMWRAKNVPVTLRKQSLALFAVVITLNILWTPLFFTLQSPALAFADICLIWLTSLAMVASFFNVRPISGWLTVPYLIWVSFALVLNGVIWLTNA